MEDKEKWLDETLNSLEGIRPADFSANLFEKTMFRLEKRTAKIVKFRPAQTWAAAACLAFLIAANVFICLKSPEINPQRGSSSSENFANEYFSFLQKPQF